MTAIYPLYQTKSQSHRNSNERQCWRVAANLSILIGDDPSRGIKISVRARFASSSKSRQSSCAQRLKRNNVHGWFDHHPGIVLMAGSIRKHPKTMVRGIHPHVLLQNIGGLLTSIQRPALSCSLSSTKMTLDLRVTRRDRMDPRCTA